MKKEMRSEICREVRKGSLGIPFSLQSVLVVALAAWMPVTGIADETGFKEPTEVSAGWSGTAPDNATEAFVDDVAEGGTDDDKSALFRTGQNVRGTLTHSPDTAMYSGFGFTIPAGSAIDGVEVVLSAYRGGALDGAVFGVRLSGDGGTTWTDFKATAALSVVDQLFTLGSDTDLWGASWDSASFTNGSFRLEVEPEGGQSEPLLHQGRQWKLDSVKANVHYTPPPPTSCEPESAWSYGDPYVTQGNWATHTQYLGYADTVGLYAGQILQAGTVAFSAPSNGEVTVTITLNDFWTFQDVQENVKIQDYETAPSGNPAPGRFSHKFTAMTSPYVFVVPANNFYGVHANVAFCP